MNCSLKVGCGVEIGVVRSGGWKSGDTSEVVSVKGGCEVEL